MRTTTTRSRAWATALAGIAGVVMLTGCGSSMLPAADSGGAGSPAASTLPPGDSRTASLTESTSIDQPRQVTITAADLPPVEALTAAPADGPQRIVSLANGVGETLVALGVADRVVGRDETSEVPADAEIVTKGHEVSAERVLSLQPDLVLIDARTSPPEAIDQIRNAGVDVVEIPEAWTMADMAPRTEAIASTLRVNATDLIATFPSTDATAPGGPRVAFLYLRGTSAIYLLGGQESGADAMIAAAGGTDVGAEAGLAPFVPLTAESLVALNPDVILVMTKGLESVNGIDGLLELPGVAQTNAGRDRRVIAVEDEILLSFGPRTGALIDLLREALRTVTS